MKEYDFISDIHGHESALRSLLHQLGYERHQSSWCHPARQMIFCGDLIDRGPESRGVVKLVRQMVETGAAQAILGNHEVNAVGFHHEFQGKPLKPQTGVAWHSHQSTLASYGGNVKAWREDLCWLGSLPFTLDFGEFRVVHAAWDEPSRGLLGAGRLHDPSFRQELAQGSADLRRAVAVLTTGYKLNLPQGVEVEDWRQRTVHAVKLAWWRSVKDASSLAQVALPLYPNLPDLPLDRFELQSLTGPSGYPETEPPVFFGHYRLPNQCDGIWANCVCIDHSGSRGTALSCFRWRAGTPVRSGVLVQLREP